MNTSHAETVRRYNVPGECRVAKTDWPYECDAKHENPDHDVYTCETHGVWWHQPPAATTAPGARVTVEEAERLLAAYDARRTGGYKNQEIAERDRIRRRTGMTVRELRAFVKAETFAAQVKVAAVLNARAEFGGPR